MNYKENYNAWLNNPKLNINIKKELETMDEETIKFSFANNLSFGTAGMRGIMGLGTNKLNIYTIRKATLGYANYLLKYIENSKDKGIVIGHDNRLNSREFCLECANLLSSFGIKVYIFDALRPTPEISFAIRKLQTAGGIIITASHNPKEYNGYKVYDETGCQLTDNKCNTLVDEINKIDDILSFEFTKNEKLITTLSSEFDEIYYNEIKKIQINQSTNKNIKIVYSPQHGAALQAVKEVLTSLGYKLYLVESQCSYDPYFSNTLSANPESKDAYIEAIKLAKKVDADLILTTDPDGDRIGMQVKHNNQYHFLTGNQTGYLLLEYILSTKKDYNSPLVVSSIVTSPLIEYISKKYNAFFRQTLTGYKYIGELMNNYENSKEFAFAVEESCGYNFSNIVRDKDGVQAALMISEMCNYYSNKGMTLIDKLYDIYEEYGYHFEKSISIQLNPLTFKDDVGFVMDLLRKETKNDIAGYKIKLIEDYSNGYLNFPKSNLLKFILEDNSFIAIRPSGTEPKCKIYYCIKEKTKEEAKRKYESIKNYFSKYLPSQN